MNRNQNVTKSVNDNIDVKSQLEYQIQIQETMFDKNNSMRLEFYKTGELKGSSNVKIPLRSSPILNTENIDKYCFLWSILAYLHPC